VQNGDPLELPFAIERYKAALAKYDAFVTTPGFAAMPPELATPFAQWARANGMTALGPLFEVAIFAYGYGQLDQISAGYVLKYIDANIFKLILDGPLPKLPGTTRWPLVFVEGFGGFWKRVGDRLTLRGVKIALSKEIKTIVRGAKVVATLTDGSAYTFDQLVVASPLDTASLAFLDLQAEERAIFDRIKYNHYVTAACEIAGVPDGWNEEPPNVQTGHVLQVWKPWDGVNMAVFYAMRDEAMTVQQVVDNFIADSPGQLHGGTITNVPYTCDWSYFPHFDEGDLRGGIYDRLDALQGRRATYYVGGLLNFETVKTTAAYSRALVEKYF
ncbi:MAG: FAD-dependent oxidoreductase, partial [Polyangiales bacterium]